MRPCSLDTHGSAWKSPSRRPHLSSSPIGRRRHLEAEVPRPLKEGLCGSTARGCRSRSGPKMIRTMSGRPARLRATYARVSISSPRRQAVTSISFPTSRQTADLGTKSTRPAPRGRELARENDAEAEKDERKEKPRRNDDGDPVRHPKRGCARTYRDTTEDPMGARKRRERKGGARRCEPRATLREKSSPYPDTGKARRHCWRGRGDV